MARFELDQTQIERLEQALRNFPGNAEQIINDVLHNEAGNLIEAEIYRLMPVSGRKDWKGKVPPAAKSKSLKQETDNLSVTVKTTSKYHYLYFPDDGATTKRHAGNQQFFFRGGESQTDEIIDRCVNRLVDGLTNL